MYAGCSAAMAAARRRRNCKRTRTMNFLAHLVPHRPAAPLRRALDQWSGFGGQGVFTARMLHPMAEKRTGRPQRRSPRLLVMQLPGRPDPVHLCRAPASVAAGAGPGLSAADLCPQHLDDLSGSGNRPLRPDHLLPLSAEASACRPCRPCPLHHLGVESDAARLSHDPDRGAGLQSHCLRRHGGGPA